MDACVIATRVFFFYIIRAMIWCCNGHSFSKMSTKEMLPKLVYRKTGPVKNDGNRWKNFYCGYLFWIMPPITLLGALPKRGGRTFTVASLHYGRALSFWSLCLNCLNAVPPKHWEAVKIFYHQNSSIYVLFYRVTIKTNLTIIEQKISLLFLTQLNTLYTKT